MRKNSKRLILALTIILALSIAAVTSNVSALPAPTASVPEFTVMFMDGSYTIPASTSIDPSTGKTVINPAQYVNNKTIQISIKYESKAVAFQEYDIRLKNHNIQEWTNITSIRADPQAEYTIFTFAIAGNNATGNFTDYLDKVSAGDTVDFQVQEELWIRRTSGGWEFWTWKIDYELWKESDWSPTQTVTIIESSVPEFSWLIIIPLFLSVLSIVVLIRKRKVSA